MIRRSWMAVAVVGALAIVVLAACESNEITGQVVQSSVVVTSHCPADGDTVLSLDTHPLVNFDVAPNAKDRATMSFLLEHRGQIVPGTVVVGGTRWRFIPAQPLDSLEIYTCAVSVGVRMEAGKLVRDFIRWTFRTGGAAASDTCG